VTDAWADYDFAVVRVVPRVDLETFENVGVVLHSRTEEYLDAAVVTDSGTLERLAPHADVELLARYLTNYVAMARGEEGAGPMSLLPPSERFHWLTAPRSDVIQCSAVHGGRTKDLPRTLEQLFNRYVTAAGPENT